jgi:hypothetical protein
MRKLYFLFILSVLFLSCAENDKLIKPVSPDNNFDSEDAVKPINDSNLKENEFNFKFTGYDININDPAWDRRSYYKIFIDKVDAGRTTIGLESQKKVFEAKLVSNNRHLLIVEKWILDEKKGEYVKLNNIEQPKPDFTYFELPADATAAITLMNDPFKNKSEFDVKIN